MHIHKVMTLLPSGMMEILATLLVSPPKLVCGKKHIKENQQNVVVLV